MEEIKAQFKKVIEYSQNIKDINVDVLFEKWKNAKKDFIDLMNGQLIYEWPEPISFELSEKDKNMRIDDFISLVDINWQNRNLADFLESQRQGFFSNQVEISYTDENGNIIPKGMKLLKAFKFFEKDAKALNDLQSAASMIIQENKVEGTLCFSVHPLDFLSASENTHNWRSCHALDGEYRAGNLSYMMDSSTVMCYLKSKRDEKLPNFPNSVPWNSKKWRVFLFFNQNYDMMFAGRQYPFSTQTGLDFIRTKLLPTLNMGQWSNWSNKKISSFNIDEEYNLKTTFSSPYVPVGNKLISMRELIIDEPGSLQFNDLLSSTCYDPVYSFKIQKNFFGNYYTHLSCFTKIRVGGKVPCLKCGKEDIESSSSVMCNHCEIKYGNAGDEDIFGTCPCCGNRFVWDEGYWVSDGDENICPNCAELYTDICESCGDRFYKDNLKYSRKYGKWYCNWCSEEGD